MEETKDTFSALFFFSWRRSCCSFARDHTIHTCRTAGPKIETKHLCSESSRPQSHWVSQYWVSRLLREYESASPTHTQTHTRTHTQKQTICDWVRIVYTSARHWKIDEPVKESELNSFLTLEIKESSASLMLGEKQTSRWSKRPKWITLCFPRCGSVRGDLIAHTTTEIVVQMCSLFS